MQIVINQKNYEHVKSEAFKKHTEDGETFWKGHRIYSPVQFRYVYEKLMETFPGIEIDLETTPAWDQAFVYIKIKFKDPADEAYFISVANDTTIIVDVPDDNFVLDDNSCESGHT